MIASSILSPPTRTEPLLTRPPSEITPTSVVPPPMSTPIEPVGSPIGMLIGETTAEQIKKEIGSAFPGSEVREKEVKGRNLAEGIPRSFTISSNETLEALTDPLNSIVSAVKSALEQTPPELGADIADKGMVLTGGGALLRDIDRLLMEETGLPVIIADDPLTCVVRSEEHTSELQ